MTSCAGVHGGPAFGGVTFLFTDIEGSTRTHAHRTARLGLSKVARMPSPVLLTQRPPQTPISVWQRGFRVWPETRR